MKEKEMLYITSARQALLAKKDQEALDLYMKAHDENEDNSEALYWVSTSLWEKAIRENESNENKWLYFRATSDSLANSVAQIADSEGTHKDKLLIIHTFLSVYAPIAEFAIKAPISSPKERIELAALAFYKTGNEIEKAFGSDADSMKVACLAWKEGVKIHQKFHAYSYDNNKVEDYVEKIKKVDPDYIVPKKAGCISFG